MAALAERKSHKKARTARTKASRKVAATDGAIHVWEDDPGSGVEPVLDARPDLAATPLAYNFLDAAPEPSGDTDTFAFRFWTAAAALRRGASSGRRGCPAASGSSDPSSR